MIAIITRARYRCIPDRQIGDLLAKPWIDSAIPAAILLLLVLTFGLVVPGFFSPGNLSDTARQWGEIGFLALGLMVVILSGGIDLSVGAIYGLASFATIAALQGLQLPVFAGLGLALLVGGAIGLVNGVLIGVLKMRAFLSTLALLIICRSLQETLALKYGAALLSDPGGLDLWFWFGDGTVLGVPVSLALLAVIGVATHFLLTRIGLGWRIQAVGGARRAAFNSGIPVAPTLVFCYVFSGLCAGMAGFLYSARTANPGADVGAGFEIVALTAAILGGNSLGGGRGSAAKAILGALIVIVIINSLVALSLPSGAASLALGLTLLLAVLVDIRWVKNRGKILDRIYISPAYFDALDPVAGPGPQQATFLTNTKLSNARPIALGKLSGPVDIVFDSQDYLYTGSSTGDVLRLSPPHYADPHVFAHIGGKTLGLKIDSHDTVYVCVSGMGLYAIGQDRAAKSLAEAVPRSMFSIKDDSRIKFPYGLDIASDGRILFSEASMRFDAHEWATDSLEMRPNGRLLVFDPRTKKAQVQLGNLVFPSGVCIEANGQSVLIAEAWACRVVRHWFDGPLTGRTEPVLEGLPGFPGNIKRSSDGAYWMALLGVRTPAHDLAMRAPGFRRRMAQRVAYDEWLYPNFNEGLVVKFSESGEVLDCLWDGAAKTYTTLTSAVEHQGCLYIGGAFNNRIGRINLPASNAEIVSTRFSNRGEEE
ncbi:MAG: ABC transporter permease [Proteobacteria bacterium]|nr:ABC transporter permease [Pseudomonadota bacterium]